MIYQQSFVSSPDNNCIIKFFFFNFPYNIT